MYDKSERVRALAVPPSVAQIGADDAHVERAARLGKCDLVTAMVGEFPELQGVMGRYYAQADGEPPKSARRCEEQYWPRFAGDELPADARRHGALTRGQARHARGHFHASARSPPARAIRSACVAPRSASCASRSSAGSTWTCLR